MEFGRLVVGCCGVCCPICLPLLYTSRACKISSNVECSEQMYTTITTAERLARCWRGR